MFRSGAFDHGMVTDGTMSSTSVKASSHGSLFCEPKSRAENDAHARPGKSEAPLRVSLFGAVPEAFKTHPLVPVQCPNPGSPPGSCTMHGDKIDLFPLLAGLGKVAATPKQNIFVPLPDHDHLVRRNAIKTSPEWWQIVTVLVTEPSYWPTADGASGITSFAKLKQAESDGVAIQTPTNYFLFFSSKPIGRLH
ncbi:MAG: hypothetical protein ACP5P4_08915 [Steroidobacteraceae bacterium]